MGDPSALVSPETDLQAAAVVMKDQARQIERLQRRVVDLLCLHREEFSGDAATWAKVEFGPDVARRLFGSELEFTRAVRALDPPRTSPKPTGR